MKKFLPWIVLALLAAIIVIVGYFMFSRLVITNSPQACTTEAQICPDGSAVGRTGPNCEFAACPAASSAQLANPASANCVQKGGSSQIITATDGSQSGMCKFPDGTQCEEWALFRNECQPGLISSPNNFKIESIDANWNIYTNSKLGFSIKIPKTIRYYDYSDCDTNSPYGYQGSSKPPVAVPIKSFEKDDSVFFAPEYFIKFNRSTKADGSSIITSCSKIITNAENVSDAKVNLDEDLPYWEIDVKSVLSDKELGEFIKSWGGSGCSLGKKTLASQTGVYNVEIKGDNKDLENTQCDVIWSSYKIKYYPQKNLVAVWGIGQQDAIFALFNGQIADQIMSDSFRFIK